MTKDPAPQPSSSPRAAEAAPPGTRPAGAKTKPGLVARLRNNFIAGVVVIAPLGITIALIYLFITRLLGPLDSFVKEALPNQYRYSAALELIPGFGVLMAFVFIIALGALAKNFIGRSLIKYGEGVLDRMPVVRNLYGFFKNVFSMALQQSERSFEQVALIEYPRRGAWSVCFIVTSSKGEIKASLEDRAGDDLVNVFVPTTPNPTSGFLLIVPRGDLKELGMSVEDAAKVIFSAGLVTPDIPDRRKGDDTSRGAGNPVSAPEKTLLEALGTGVGAVDKKDR